MNTLDEIAIKHGTDKATVHPIKGHGYCPFYERFFEPLRHQPIKLLEIGVGGGESIRTWLEYFTNATVCGIDIVSGTNPWNTVNSTANPRYVFVNGDQSSDVFWKCFLADYGRDWDIIIDDGGHCNYQIIASFNGLWDAVKSGGFYCVEDLGCSYGTGSVFVRAGDPTHSEFVKGKIDAMNTVGGFESIHCCQELVIFKKV